MARRPRKTPRAEPAPGETTGSGLGSLERQEREKHEERNNILLHCRSSY